MYALYDNSQQLQYMGFARNVAGAIQVCFSFLRGTAVNRTWQVLQPGCFSRCKPPVTLQYKGVGLCALYDDSQQLQYEGYTRNVAAAIQVCPCS